MRKKGIVTFLAVLLGVFVASAAMALDYGEVSYTMVNFNGAAIQTAGTILNPEGKGDVLLFPYYDVRTIDGRGTATLFAIINENSGPDFAIPTTEEGIAAKLRFREWDKSGEVFDVDIWLSEGDVWVGVLDFDAASFAIDPRLGARITSPDWVITAPAVAGNLCASTFTLQAALATPVPFPITAIQGTVPNIPVGSSNHYGYFEVIAEERTYSKSFVDAADGNKVKVTRVFAAACVPADAPNTLLGYAYIVDVVGGVSAGYTATAIANFVRTPTLLFSGAGGLLPTLLQCEDSLNQLEFEISKQDIWAAFDVSTVIAGQAGLVITHPTKHFHYCPGPNYTLKGSPTAPCGIVGEGLPWTALHANAFETVVINVCDRNENCLTPDTSYISPLPPVATVGLPYEVNVVGLFLGSTVPSLTGRRPNFGIATKTYDTGYVWFRWANAGVINPAPSPLSRQFGTGATITSFEHFGMSFGGPYPTLGYVALPTIGIQWQYGANGAVGGIYGETMPVWYEVDWRPAAVFP